MILAGVHFMILILIIFHGSYESEDAQCATCIGGYVRETGFNDLCARFDIAREIENTSENYSHKKGEFDEYGEQYSLVETEYD